MSGKGEINHLKFPTKLSYSVFLMPKFSRIILENLFYIQFMSLLGIISISFNKTVSAEYDPWLVCTLACLGLGRVIAYHHLLL